MNTAAPYALSVTAAAVVAAILITLSGQGIVAGSVRLLAGIFVTLTVVSPILKLEVGDPQAWFSNYAEDGQAAAAAGEAMANEAAHSFIKDRVETYILDIAAVYGVSPAAEVSLDPQGRPEFIVLTGDVSAYAKTRIAERIREDLGLGEEALQWHS